MDFDHNKKSFKKVALKIEKTERDRRRKFFFFFGKFFFSIDRTTTSLNFQDLILGVLPQNFPQAAIPFLLSKNTTPLCTRM